MSHIASNSRRRSLQKAFGFAADLFDVRIEEADIYINLVS
jgi:hypothetical protein